MARRVIGQARLFAVAKPGRPEQPPIETAMTAAGLPIPEVEYRFWSGRDWRFDYCWPPWKIALEIEGGGFGRFIVITSGYERRKGKSIPIEPGTVIRAGGRHNTGKGMQDDAIKYNRAAILGWLVIRATTTMVRDGLAIRELVDAFQARGIGMTKTTTKKPPQTRPSSTDTPQLWTLYRVRWEFLTRLCASVPADQDMIRTWLENREPRVKPAGALSIDEINEEVLASIERGEGEAPQDYSMLVFQRNNGILVQRAGTVRAHMKDCARVLSAQFIGRIEGERAFSTRVINGVYHDEREYWLPIQRADGTPVTMADGAFDKAIHPTGPRGQRISALKRFEFIEPPSFMEFTLKVLGRSVSEVDLHHLFTYGGTHGYAGERSDGEGRYTYTLTRIE